MTILPLLFVCLLGVGGRSTFVTCSFQNLKNIIKQKKRKITITPYPSKYSGIQASIKMVSSAYIYIFNFSYKSGSILNARLCKQLFSFFHVILPLDGPTKKGNLFPISWINCYVWRSEFRMNTMNLSWAKFKAILMYSYYRLLFSKLSHFASIYQITQTSQSCFENNF